MLGIKFEAFETQYIVSTQHFSTDLNQQIKLKRSFFFVMGSENKNIMNMKTSFETCFFPENILTF